MIFNNLKKFLNSNFRPNIPNLPTESLNFINRPAKIFNQSSEFPQNLYKKLGRDYFRQEVVHLAKDLLGKVIVRHLQNGKSIRCRIVETEAYKAPHDKACHAYNNKKTLRTKPFWYDGGHWYVFTIYMKTNVC